MSTVLACSVIPFKQVFAVPTLETMEIMSTKFMLDDTSFFAKEYGQEQGGENTFLAKYPAHSAL